MWEKFKIRNIWIKWAIRILIIAHFGAFSCGGCGDTNINNSIVGECMTLAGTSVPRGNPSANPPIPECCDANGVAISPPPEGCPGPPQGSIGGDVIDPGTEAVVATADALDNAETLIGGDNANDVGSDPTTLAATAGPGDNNNGSAIVPSGRIGEPNLSLPEAGLNKKSGGGGGTPRSSTGGGPNGVKGTLPAYSGDEDLAKAQRSLEGDTQLAAYAGGGGGTAKSGGNKFGGGLFGSGGTSGSSGSISGVNGKSQSFGGEDRELASVFGAAPDDYLGRISLLADIFKVVAKRYRETSVQWALKDSKNRAKESASLSSRTSRNPAKRKSEKLN